MNTPEQRPGRPTAQQAADMPTAAHPQYPAPMPPRQSMPPAPRSQKKTILTHGAVGLVCLILGVGIGAAGSESEDTNDSGEPSASAPQEETEEEAPPAAEEPEAEAEPAGDAEPEPEGPAESFSDGVHLVGEDIAPGEYVTDGPDPDGLVPMCYWSRNSDASGELGSIIANENLQGPGRVTVNDGEYFEVSGGCEWNIA